jgi:hypothetical protein
MHHRKKAAMTYLFVSLIYLTQNVEGKFRTGGDARAYIAAK